MKKVMNTFVRSIKNFKYPFLMDLQSVDEKTLATYATQINEIAKDSYTQPGQTSPTMSYGKLHALIAKDPSAWHVYIEKHAVKGFIHIQLLSSDQAKELRDGLVDESSLEPTTANCQQEQVIHIGSVVSQSYPHPISNKLPLYLIAGAVDKILKLREENPLITRIITCDFEDKFGKRHFAYKLPNYGFVQTGTSAGGDTVWELDLESSNRPFSGLITAVSSKRIAFLNNVDYLPIFKHVITQLPSTLKPINQTLAVVIKLVKQIGELKDDG